MNFSTCRFCDAKIVSFCDLGESPLANSFLNKNELEMEEPFYRLHAYVCEACYLVQLEEVQSPKKIFKNYAYFSSYSSTWLKHCEDYANRVINRFNLNKNKQVIEIASNDGCLLSFFKEREIPVLGIEPAKNISMKAESSGIPTINRFFNSQLAKELDSKKKQADLLIGNNVLAHVPNLNDFVASLKIILKPKGIITLEFPSLLE
ncbi:uncharacterized protein METZ01_LOCUS496768, partial [marine metagenome]